MTIDFVLFVTVFYYSLESDGVHPVKCENSRDSILFCTLYRLKTDFYLYNQGIILSLFKEQTKLTSKAS